MSTHDLQELKRIGTVLEEQGFNFLTPKEHQTLENTLLQEIGLLEDALEAAQKDAERYRILRSDRYINGCDVVVKSKMGNKVFYGQDLDIVIDAAIEKEPE